MHMLVIQSLIYSLIFNNVPKGVCLVGSNDATNLVLIGYVLMIGHTVT